MLRCFILDDYQQVALRMADWSPLSGRVEVHALPGHIGEQNELVATLAEADIVLAMRERTPFLDALLARLPRLRLLTTTGMVNAAIDIAAAARRGITVCGTRGGAGAAAELAWGLLLAVMRHLPQEVAGLRQGGPWQTSVGHDLNGRTLGLLGLGRLGTRMARYGQAFDMKVIAWSPHLTQERADAAGVALVGKDTLFQHADVLAVQMVLSATTRGLVGARELALMPPHAVLVNTSRGPLVDEAALIAALENKRLLGAGLDVFEQEPLPADHPFRRLPNVVATPHLGYVTEETYRCFFADTVENIAAWMAGAPVRVIGAPD